MRVLMCLVLITFAVALFAQDAFPTGAPRWSETTATSLLRGEMALEGAWRFAPTVKEAPAHGWGWIAVPGSWRDERSLLGRGADGHWATCERNAVRSAWYEREITVPVGWTGRAVLLDLTRVSTDDTVYLDGARCGTVTWPEGDVDPTAAVKPGPTQRLRYAQRFDFRECWIEGRTIMLNGSEWRLRPLLGHPDTPAWAIEALARGHNFCVLRPNDPWERSAAKILGNPCRCAHA